MYIQVYLTSVLFIWHKGNRSLWQEIYLNNLIFLFLLFFGCGCCCFCCYWPLFQCIYIFCLVVFILLMKRNKNIYKVEGWRSFFFVNCICVIALNQKPPLLFLKNTLNSNLLEWIFDALNSDSLHTVFLINFVWK